MSWITISIPYYLPSSEFVAYWMMAGGLTLIWCAIATLPSRRSGYTPTVIRRPVWEGLLGTALVVMAWPIALYLTTKSWNQRRRAAT